jgi:hypothetical protein
MVQTSASPDQIAGSRRSERPIRQASSTATQKKDHADLDEASHNGEVDPGPVVTVTLEELPQSIYGHGDQPQEEDILGFKNRAIGQRAHKSPSPPVLPEEAATTSAMARVARVGPISNRACEISGHRKGLVAQAQQRQRRVRGEDARRNR